MRKRGQANPRKAWSTLSFLQILFSLSMKGTGQNLGWHLTRLGSRLVMAASPASGRAAGPWTALCPGGHRWRGEVGRCSHQKMEFTNARHFRGAGGFEVLQILTSFGWKAVSSDQAWLSHAGDQRGMSESSGCHSHAGCSTPGLRGGFNGRELP